jgi:hypothetical protein
MLHLWKRLSVDVLKVIWTLAHVEIEILLSVTFKLRLLGMLPMLILAKFEKEALNKWMFDFFGFRTHDHCIDLSLKATKDLNQSTSEVLQLTIPGDNLMFNLKNHSISINLNKINVGNSDKSISCYRSRT